MPERLGDVIHIPVQPEGKTYEEIRTISINADRGISALYGLPEKEIKTYLFDVGKGWTLETAKAWVKEHTTTPATQADLFPEDTETLDIPDADLPKYIEVRQHDPAHFTGYQHKWLNKATGIVKSVGQWRKTGAEVVQKLLFRLDHGWTEETVRSWFADHPEYHYPQSEGLFLAMSENSIPEITTILHEAATFDLTQQGQAYEVTVITGGWGKNTRRGRDGQIYRDYFTTDFLQSLLPLLDQSAVQAIKLLPTSAIEGDPPTAIVEIAHELRRLGHPPAVINRLLSHGLAGNTIGFLTDIRMDHSQDDLGTNPTVPEIRARFVLADSEAGRDAAQLIQSAWNMGLSRALGLSINYRAIILFGNIDGQAACIHQTATHHVSTELVPNPAAGGKIRTPLQQGSRTPANVVQGEDTMNTHFTDDRQMTLETASDHEANQEDLATAQNEPVQESDVGSPADAEASDERVPESPPAPQEPDLEKHPPKKDDPIQDAPQEDLENETHTLSAEAIQQMIHKAFSEGVQPLSDAVRGILTKDKRQGLRGMLAQAQIGQAKKDLIRKKIDAGEYTRSEDVEFAIALAQGEPQTPVFPGMSGIQASIQNDPRDVMKIRTKLTWGLPLDEAEQKIAKDRRIQPFLGLQSEYVAYTGDHDIRMRGIDWNVLFRQVVHPDLIGHDSLTQTVSTSTYTDLLTNIINRSLEAHYLMTDKTWEKMVKVGAPYTDNRDHEEWIVAQFPEIAAVSEGGAYQEVAYGAVEKMTNSSQKYGNLFQVTEETIQDDDLDYVRASIQQFGNAMNRTVFRKVMDKILAYSTTVNGATMTDSIAGTLYNNVNRGSNWVNGSIENYEDVRTLIEYMLTQVDYPDDAGGKADLMLQPWIFVGNITKIGYVRSYVRGEYEAGRPDWLPNTLHMTQIPAENFVGVHPNYLYDVANEGLFILPDPRQFAGLKISYFRGMMTPEFVWEGNQQAPYGSVFSSDVLKLRLKFKFRLGYQRLKAFYALWTDV